MKLSDVYRNATKWIKRYNNGVWKVIFIIQFLVLVYVSFKMASVLLGGGLTYDEFHNNYCQDNKNEKEYSGVKLNGTNDSPCDFEYKFKKV